MHFLSSRRGALIALLSVLCILFIGCEDETSGTEGSAGVEGGEGTGAGAEGGEAGDAESGESGDVEAGETANGGTEAGETVNGGTEAGVLSGQEAGEQQSDMGQSAGDSLAGVEMLTDMNLTSLSIIIDSPAEGMSFISDEDIIVRGLVSVEGGSLEFVGVEATLDESQNIPVLLDRESGAFTLVITEPSPGEHILSIRAAIAPDHRVESLRRFTVSCPMENEFDQPLDPTMWVARGPAIRDNRGWLELTQNQINTRGALFWAGSPVQPGDLDLEFSFSTSKCEEPGECTLNRINAGGGFSINFWDIRPQELEALWEVTSGLGNVTPKTLLDEQGMSRIDSFHIVFDTYSNTCTPCSEPRNFDGCGNRHEEPTAVNHVSLIFNGHQAIHGEPDESGSYCHLGPVSGDFSDRWTAFPELDDGRWHRAHLTIDGTRIQLSINDQPLIDFELPSLRFKGGVLSIAAGSGVNGNFHRIDRLRINDQCR